MKKAVGLGKKRKAEETIEEEDQNPAQVYFALDDTSENGDEVAQVAAMLAHAELCLEEEEKALPLLRAVVHECDRIGRLKDALQEDQTASDIGIEEEQAASLKALSLTEEFYRVYGDALYRLALLEPPLKSQIECYHPDFLKSALEIYYDALDIFPSSTTLKLSLTRAKCLACKDEEEMERLVGDWLSLIESLEGEPKLRALVSLLSFTETASTTELVLSNDLYRMIINFSSGGEFAQELAVKLGILGLYDIILDTLFELEEYEQLQEQLSKAQKVIDTLDLNKDHPDTYQALIPRIAQIYLLSGSLAEIQEHDDLARQHYEKAQSLWQDLSTEYGIEIPESIRALSREDAEDESP